MSVDTFSTRDFRHYYMEEEIHPVKKYLFDYLENDRIQDKLSLEKSSELTKKIISDCIPKISQFKGNYDENIAILTTGIIHYMLTNLLIPSQRKITINDVELDVVVPDARTLSSKPQDAIVINIPKILDPIYIEEQLSEIAKIQPEKQNIWLVLPRKLNVEQKNFILTKNFVNIFKEINEFVSSKKVSRFKIFKN